MSNQPTGFFVAPFVIDGELEGIGFWEFGKLSAQWLDVCRSILADQTGAFEIPWQGKQSHIRTRVTASSSAALFTFRVHGAVVSSLALVSGVHPGAENDLLRMFMQSLKRLELTKAASASAVPFEKIMTIEERPLMIVVPWPNDTATQDDIYLVKDLSTHLAAAFFEKVAGQMPTGNGGGS